MDENERAQDEDRTDALTGDGAPDREQDGHPEPDPVGGSIVQDNVSDPENPSSSVGSGVPRQDNVSEEGVHRTHYPDGGVSEHRPDEVEPAPSGTPAVDDPAVAGAGMAGDDPARLGPEHVDAAGKSGSVSDGGAPHQEPGTSPAAPAGDPPGGEGDPADGE